MIEKPLLIAWELQCQYETENFGHSHKHESNCNRGLQWFLPESESRNLSLLYHFGGDST